MTTAQSDIIGEAVYENRTFSAASLSDRLFAMLFRGLVYPQIWEDPVCDMEALGLSEADDVVCIASGSCNMMSYLSRRPASVTAVDLSPWHLQLGQLKIKAAQVLPDYDAFYLLFGNAATVRTGRLFDQYILPEMDAEARAFWNGPTLRPRKSMFAKGFYRFGALGRTLGALNVVTRLAGVNLRELTKCKTLEDQQAFFDAKIAPLYEKRIVKWVASSRASLFGLGIPPAQYEKLAGDAGGDIIPVLKERTRKLFCDFPIRENYFAWQAATREYKRDGTGPLPPYLQEQHFEAIRDSAARASIQNRSVTDMLAEADAGSKSVYILLDAQDWMTDDQLNSLWKEITRTARPGARVLFRTGGAPDILPGRVAAETLDQWSYDADASQRAFETDRSAIYGGVHLYRLKDEHHE